MKLSDFLSPRNSVVDLAKRIEVAPSMVSQWKNGVRPIPAERCPEIEKATGGVVRCEDLRPDVDWAYLRGTNATVAAEICPNLEKAA
jgi:DNA-binding transcriptional regulator YdaS (Cro superfamily)